MFERQLGFFKLSHNLMLFSLRFLSHVDAGLDKVWEVKPLVDGKEIMSILDLKTGGPLVREWVIIILLK